MNSEMAAADARLNRHAQGLIVEAPSWPRLWRRHRREGRRHRRRRGGRGCLRSSSGRGGCWRRRGRPRKPTAWLLLRRRPGRDPMGIRGRSVLLSGRREHRVRHRQRPSHNAKNYLRLEHAQPAFLNFYATSSNAEHRTSGTISFRIGMCQANTPNWFPHEFSTANDIWGTK
jgi:hypothetical protein